MLRASEDRTVRRASRPSNMGKSWDDAEVEALRVRFKSGAALEEIAQMHGRTVRAIRLRLKRLGALEPDSLYVMPSTPQQAASEVVDPAVNEREVARSADAAEA